MFEEEEDDNAEADAAAVQFGYVECGCCYEDLYKDVVSVMVGKDGKRVCRHFVHRKCVATLEASDFGLRCPICQEPFHATHELPDPNTDAAAWFRVVDMSGRGRLKKWYVIDALCATVNIDGVKLQDNIEKLWSQWDVDGSNTITMEEFLHPKRGLLLWVREHIGVLRRQSGLPPPDIKKHGEDWFHYWDDPIHGGDGTGQLTKEETTRAMMKTFRSEDILFMRNLVCALWGDFDVDGSGTIKPSEFLRPNIGLRDTILANMKTLDNIVSQAAVECTLCFQQLHVKPVAGLSNSRGRRVCKHYYHSDCIRKALAQSSQWHCPRCKIRFVNVHDIPDPLQDAKAWFRAVDVDNTDQLTRWEVVDALIATTPIDGSKFSEELESLWETWDKTSSNTITLAEFLDPDEGLLHWIQEHLAHISRQALTGPIPDIRRQREDWFRYWDNPANGGDGTGQLTKAETVRALMKTLNSTEVEVVKSLVEALWDDFDVDNSGTIKPHEFLRPEIGLLDTVLANLN